MILRLTSGRTSERTSGCTSERTSELTSGHTSGRCSNIPTVLAGSFSASPERERERETRGEPPGSESPIYSSFCFKTLLLAGSPHSRLLPKFRCLVFERCMFRGCTSEASGGGAWLGLPAPPTPAPSVLATSPTGATGPEGAPSPPTGKGGGFASAAAAEATFSGYSPHHRAVPAGTTAPSSGACPKAMVEALAAASLSCAGRSSIAEALGGIGTAAAGVGLIISK